MKTGIMGKKIDRAYLMHLLPNFENEEIARLMGAAPNTISIYRGKILAEGEAKRRPRDLKLGDDYIEYKRKGG